MARALGVAVVLLMAGGAASPLLAAGFAIKQQSAAAQGSAFAGATAGAENLSYMYFNPAALGRFDEHAVHFEANAIVTSLELREAEARTTAGAPISGRGHKGDAGDDALVPSFYAMTVPSDDLRLGLAVTVPFGLGSEYPESWVGRYHTTRSSLASFNINPVIAYRLADWISIGAGFQAQWTEAEFANAVDFGTLGAAVSFPGAMPAQQDGRAKVEGDGWGLGFNFGLLLEPRPGTRLGFAYRSSIETTIKGDARFRLDEAGIGTALRAGLGAFRDVDAEAELELPPMASFGIHQDIGDGFALMAEAQWTGWSTLDALAIEFDNPAQPDNVTAFDWDDAWFFAIGGSWQATDRLKLRLGGAFDQTPTRNANRTPRVPDANRWWLSTGLGWQMRDNLSLDLAYTHVFLEEAELRQRGTGTGNATRGDLNARYQNAIDVVTLAVNWRF